VNINLYKAYAGKPILGALIVKDGLIVLTIPMLMDKAGNWNGRV